MNNIGSKSGQSPSPPRLVLLPIYSQVARLARSRKSAGKPNSSTQDAEGEVKKKRGAKRQPSGERVERKKREGNESQVMADVLLRD